VLDLATRLWFSFTALRPPDVQSDSTRSNRAQLQSWIPGPGARLTIFNEAISDLKGSFTGRFIQKRRHNEGD